MQPIFIDMIENKIKSAQFKLSQHKAQGSNSTLSIFQVASLMDLVRLGGSGQQDTTSNSQFLLN